MQLKKPEQTPYEVMSDRIHAAMETGNMGRAREALAEGTLNPVAELRLRQEVQREYGIRL